MNVLLNYLNINLKSQRIHSLGLMDLNDKMKHCETVAVEQRWATGGQRDIYGPQSLLVRPAGLYYTRMINLKNI